MEKAPSMCPEPYPSVAVLSAAIDGGDAVDGADGQTWHLKNMLRQSEHLLDNPSFPDGLRHDLERLIRLDERSRKWNVGHHLSATAESDEIDGRLLGSRPVDDAADLLFSRRRLEGQHDRIVQLLDALQVLYMKTSSHFLIHFY